MCVIEENSSDEATNENIETDNIIDSVKNTDKITSIKNINDTIAVERNTFFVEEVETDNSENYDDSSVYIPNKIHEFFELLYNKIKDGSLDEEINKNDIVVYGNNMVIQATTSSKQKYYIENNINTNLSLIELTECEKKLGLNKPLL